jgi:hypothetical protein
MSLLVLCPEAMRVVPLFVPRWLCVGLVAQDLVVFFVHAGCRMLSVVVLWIPGVIAGGGGAMVMHK